MIVKDITAIKDFGFKNLFENTSFYEGETRSVKFKNEAEFKALLSYGNFVEKFKGVPVIQPVTKSIPIVSKQVDRAPRAYNIESSDKKVIDIPQETPTLSPAALKDETDINASSDFAISTAEEDLAEYSDCPNCSSRLILIETKVDTDNKMIQVFKCSVCGEIQSKKVAGSTKEEKPVDTAVGKVKAKPGPKPNKKLG